MEENAVDLNPLRYGPSGIHGHKQLAPFSELLFSKGMVGIWTRNPICTCPVIAEWVVTGRKGAL